MAYRKKAQVLVENDLLDGGMEQYMWPGKGKPTPKRKDARAARKLTPEQLSTLSGRAPVAPPQKQTVVNRAVKRAAGFRTSNKKGFKKRQYTTQKTG